jgi:5-methyltetrahydropteroyltriglutamate--homocysteine methyltransferase
MNVEYKAIVDSGFLLQIDDPHLVTHYVKDADITLREARRWAAKRVDYLNHALRDIPQDRVRFHTCAGINIGPRVSDMQLKDIVDILLRVNAGAYSFEYGNPRHEHEHQVWKDAALPDDKILIPGMISNSTVLVEHPELVADRIVRFADIVGKERVMAGADCGFASIASNQEFPTTVIWEKFKSLVEGARLATKRLW